MATEKYEAVIGLEVHAQLQTKSKAFASDSTLFGEMPNTNVSAITLAHPGTLPRINKSAVEMAVKMGLACSSHINRFNFFDRKNYFYPDLPKGYQTTQDNSPICKGGKVVIKLADGTVKTVTLNRIHMEEDAGKSMHLDQEVDTLVDYNRAGVPLIEIVTEPDMRTSEEAGVYMAEMRKLVRYLDICDGNMEEGSLRCDANISVRLKGETKLGKKVEVKNMNSIRNVMRAIEYEIKRQVEEIEKGNTIVSMTRLFDATDGKTYAMREKEELNDYRYFPEPDLQPLLISDEWLKAITDTMPALPNELLAKFTGEYELPEYDARVLTDSKELALYFDELCKHTNHYKGASNLVMGAMKSYLNERAMDLKDFGLTPVRLAGLVDLTQSGKVSSTVAVRELFPVMVERPEVSAEELAKEKNLLQSGDEDFINDLADKALALYPEKVQEYRSGKKGLMGLFMGELMKMSKGKADPKVATEALRKKLEA